MELQLTRPSSRNGKEKLLNAASTLFAQGSYQNVSVAQILDLCQVKAPSLYHHFGDKEGLYLTWATQTLHEVGENLRSANTLEDFVQALLDGERIDYFQVLRDMRDLSQAQAKAEIENAIAENLYLPAKLVVQRELGITDLVRLQTLSTFLLHSAMYCHPVYRSPESETKADYSTVKWIADLVRTAARQ